MPPTILTLLLSLLTAAATVDTSSSSTSISGLLRCACDPRYCAEDTCETDGVCFVSLKRNEDKVDKVLRCVDKAYLIPEQRPIICDFNRKQNHTYANKCCKEKDLCNAELEISLASALAEQGEDAERAAGPLSYEIVLAVLIPVALLLLLVLLFYVFRRKKTGSPFCSLDCHLGFYQEVESVETQSTYPGSSLHDSLSATTGSGSGLPLLVQRSVARQIGLISIIGKGRFGEVWKGQWRGENVAVKIFSSVDEKSWFREVEIYQTVMLRHPNILGFIAADNKDNVTWTQLWLVMEYMEHGSLYDYLHSNTVSPQKLVQMCLCVATGLAHLHMEIVGTHGKPAIAHRDLKSKNILVKADGVCAIGDLGLAVRYNQESNVIDLPQNLKVGTKRYLAPELLDGSINLQDFESFKKADVYSLGLVLWEICVRCHVPGRSASEYNLPYFEIVGVDPSLEEMRKVVCTDGARPDVSDYWASDSVLSEMTRLMTECWYERASSRLTALRVKKTLTDMAAGLNDKV